MSIWRTVTIHCDGCGHWVHGADEGGTRAMRRRGWKIWQDEETGSWQHLCPSCTGQQAAGEQEQAAQRTNLL